MGIKEVLRKSVLRNTVISLTKARPTKYYRREKKGGKWRYYYTREQYQKERGAETKGISIVTVAGKSMLEVTHNGKVFRVNSNGVVQPKEGWKEGYAWGTKQATGNESYAVMNKVHAAGYKASGIGDSKKYNFKVPPATSVQQGKVSVSTKDKKPVLSAAGGGAKKGENGKESKFEKKMKDMKDSPKGKFGESLAGLESAYKRLSEKDKKSPKGIEFKKEIEAVRRGKDLTRE